MLWISNVRPFAPPGNSPPDECPDIDGYNAGCDTADDNSFDLFGNILVHVGASLKSFYALSIDASCEIVNTGKKS